MNYMYDILLNFNPQLFEVFEWDINDTITHIRKIPLFKVSNITLHDFINNKIILSDSFLKTIYQKTEYYEKGKIKKLDCAFLITDGKLVIAVESGKCINYCSSEASEDCFASSR